MKTFIDPTIILVSNKIDDAVIDRFDPDGRSGESVSADNDQFRLPFLLEVRPSNEFNYDAAKKKLVNLRLGQDNGTRVRFSIPGEVIAIGHRDEESIAGQQEQLLRLSGWIDMESYITVSS